MQLVLIAALVAVLVALSVISAGQRFAWRLVMKRRVLVQTTDGVAINGVVTAQRGPLIELADVTIHADGTQRPADGRIVIDRAHVAWMQKVDG